MFLNKNSLLYLLKFIMCFCVLYYGTMAMIGLASPGGHYVAFIHDYLDYVGWLRFLLLHTSKKILAALGYNTFVDGLYTIYMYGGRGVRLVYSCIGFGVMSFWIAFIYANKVHWQKKVKWAMGGIVLLFFINVIRISLLLVVINDHWNNPFNLDNHTLFNIVAYIFIFIMIYLFDLAEKKADLRKTNN